MSLGRRFFLFGTAAAALVGVRSVGFDDGGIVRRTLDVIEEVYGPEFSQDPEGVRFARAYQDFIRKKGMQGIGLDTAYKFHMEKFPYTGSVDGKVRQSVIDKFATSTNAILAFETGVPLEFGTIFHAYDAPCTNRLAPHNV